MMRIVLALSLMVFATSCARKDATTGLLLPARTGPADSQNQSGQKSSFDSTFFIGYVDFFPETGEFYTALFYDEGHEYPDEELLESKLDSVILLEDDWGRERLPMEEARKILVLAGLDTLSFFNRRHQLICRSPLERVEYLWDGLENYFVAVYKADKKFTEQTEELYAITTRYEQLRGPSFAAPEVIDQHLNDYLAKELHIDRRAECDMRHYRISAAEETYSVVSSYSIESNETASYLTMLDGIKLTILNEELNNYHFLNILPLPVKMNGKPLLLISAGYPSSDVLWDYLAGFDGTRYEAIDYNRAHVGRVGN